MTEATPGGSVEPVLRAGMVAVVGRANVGKSTLVNRLLGEKVSIVSPVAQTTRNLVRGILTEERGQLVFLDTPGMHKAESDLGKLMNRVSRASVEGTDIAMLVLDASSRPKVEDDGWMRRLMKEPDVKVLCVLNKSDAEPQCGEAYRELWRTIAEEKGSQVKPTWIPTSATRGSGCDTLLADLFEAVPLGPYLFPDDILTDFPRKLTIGDVVREKYFAVLKQELPHSLAIWVEEIEDSRQPWHVSGIVYVERHGQKGIVLGKKGSLLKKVQREAEQDLAEMYGVPMKLDLWVKVEKDWTKNFWILRKLGYA